MADLVAQFGIDDSDFERGVRRSERTAIDSAQRVYNRTTAMASKQAREHQGWASRIQTAYTKGWAAVEKGMTSVVAAGYLVARSVDEYGKRFSYARGQAEDLQRAVDNFKTSLGRDLSGAGGGNMLADVVNWGSRARETLTDVTAAAAKFYTFGLFGKSLSESAEIDNARKRLEAQDLEAANSKIFGENDLDLRIREAEAGGDTDTAVRLRVQQRRRQAAERIAGLGLDNGRVAELQEREFAVIEQEERARADREADRTNSAAYLRTRNANSSAFDSVERRRVEAEAERLRAAGQRGLAAATLGEFEIGQGSRRLRQQGADDEAIARFEASEREALQQRIAAEEAERQERRRERIEQIEHGQKMFRVEELARQGKTKEAEILRARLATERTIAELRSDELLGVEERARFIAAEQRALGERIEGIQTRTRGSATRSLAGGTVTALTRQTVLGGGRSIETIAARQLGEAEKQTALLATIAENGSGGVL